MREQRTFMISKVSIQSIKDVMGRSGTATGTYQDGFEECWKMMMDGIDEFPNDLHYMYRMTHRKCEAEAQRRDIAGI